MAYSIDALWVSDCALMASINSPTHSGEIQWVYISAPFHQNIMHLLGIGRYATSGRATTTPQEVSMKQDLGRGYKWLRRELEFRLELEHVTYEDVTGVLNAAVPYWEASEFDFLEPEILWEEYAPFLQLFRGSEWTVMDSDFD